MKFLGMLVLIALFTLMALGGYEMYSKFTRKHSPPATDSEYFRVSASEESLPSPPATATPLMIFRPANYYAVPTQPPPPTPAPLHTLEMALDADSTFREFHENYSRFWDHRLASLKEDFLRKLQSDHARKPLLRWITQEAGSRFDFTLERESLSQRLRQADSLAHTLRTTRTFAREPSEIEAELEGRRLDLVAWESTLADGDRLIHDTAELLERLENQKITNRDAESRLLGALVTEWEGWLSK